MDKETILEFCSNKSTLLALEIIASYCEDMGKKSEDINIFIQTLRMSPIIIASCISTAVQYYKNKYQITDIYLDNKIIQSF